MKSIYNFLLEIKNDFFQKTKISGRTNYKKAAKTYSSCLNFSLVLFIFLHLPAITTAQEYNYKFDRYTIDDGLSQSTIRCIFQDQRGFMWFGTEDGLNRFDGYEFKKYYHDAENPNSLSNNSVWAILEDLSGTLWIGTDGGLNRYDRDRDCFIHFQHIPEDSSSLSNNIIWALCEDRSGTLWIGSASGGLNKLNPDKKTFAHYKHLANDVNSLSDNTVLWIMEDKNGFLWIGTKNGLNRFNKQTNSFTQWFKNPEDPNSLFDNKILCITEDRSGLLWIGTASGLNCFDSKTNKIQKRNIYEDGSKVTIWQIFEDHSGLLWIGTDAKGLFILDRKQKKFFSFQSNQTGANNFSKNQIYSIFEDRTNVLWVGCGTGLNKLNKGYDQFITYRANPNDPYSISDNGIWAINEDNKGFLWIGTDEGLNRFDQQTRKFTFYGSNLADAVGKYFSGVTALCEGQNGKLWISAYDKGVIVFYPQNNSFEKYQNDPDDTTTISSNSIFSIYEDSAGDLWFGADIGVLNKFDQKSKRFIRYKISVQDSNYASRNYIWSIYEDSSGKFWIGSNLGGLYLFDRETGKFKQYKNQPDNPESLSNNSVLSIAAGNSGILWIGTAGGLNKFDPATEKFTHYRLKDGLPNEMIYGILFEDPSKESETRCLWLSTNKGLSKFNPATDAFRNYDVNDGLQSNEFNGGAYFKSKSGEMFFGGINGLTSFYPKNIKDDIYVPPIVLTDLLLFGESVRVSEKKNSLLRKSISEVDQIELSYQQDDVEFKFAALHFSAPQKNQYAYKLDGLDKEWKYIGTKNSVQYHHLPPGDYVFRVKGSNSDGIWNEQGSSVKIKIIPPFWKKAWFKILGYLFIILILISTHRIRTHFIKRRNKELEEFNLKLKKEISKRKKAEKNMAASLKEKTILLQEIHHRVKNNLNVVTSLLNTQLRRLTDKKAIEAFKDSVSRVYAMAQVHNQLYRSDDLANINIKQYIKSMANRTFINYRLNHNVSLELDIEELNLTLDNSIPLGLLLNEMMSNACKHAFPKNRAGTVRVSLKKVGDDLCEFIVQDDGVGMPENTNFDTTESLGLHLIKILTAQMEGTMKLIKEKGTKFVIRFEIK